MPLVSTDEMIKYMDISFSPRQREGVSFVLEGLEAELEAYLKRPVDVSTFTERYVIYPEYTYGEPWHVSGFSPVAFSGALPLGIGLRNTPVISIESVHVGSVGDTIDVPQLQIGEEDFIMAPYGLDILYGLSAFQTVVVNYTAGQVGPETRVFKLLIMRAASREISNLHDDNVGIQEYEARNVAPALATGFSDKELLSVKRYKRQRI